MKIGHLQAIGKTKGFIALLEALRAVNFCQRVHHLIPDEWHWADRELMKKEIHIPYDYDVFDNIKCPRKKV